MDDDASSYEEAVPLSEDPRWSDMQPLVVSEGDAPVVAIQYPPHQVEVLAYFRQILAQGEWSERAYALTTQLIEINQADYTAWEWRWRCLVALKKDLKSEYEFTDSIMHDNAKNYQLWNHRRKCALMLGPDAAARELQVAAEALAIDPKNYHAWAHRQAIVKEFGGMSWEEELAYSEKHIQQDVRNNSAWNQRAFVVRHQLEQQSLVFDEDPREIQNPALASLPVVLRQLINRELEYVAGQIERAPRNESSWRYLTSLFVLPGMPPHAMGLYEQVAVICREALLDAPSCPVALDTYAQYYEHLAALSLQGQLNIAATGLAATTQHMQAGLQSHKQAVEAAVGCCFLLLDSLSVADPVRSMYWRQRHQCAMALLNAANQPDALVGAAAAPVSGQ